MQANDKSKKKMKPLHEQAPKLRLFHLRESLIKIHLDLFKINAKVHGSLDFPRSGLTELEKMCLVLEDRRFFDHHGIDVWSAARETLRALTFRRHGGASTIDMQFVRTCTGYRELTLGRKVYEMLLAVLIQFRYSKIAILRSYLNCAYFGAQPRGASSAAQIEVAPQI